MPDQVSAAPAVQLLYIAPAADTVSVDGANSVPSLFVDLPYSPALLLDARFGVELTDHQDFAVACEEGFDGYFSEMYYWNEDGSGTVFVDHFFTWDEVREMVVQEVMARGNERVFEQLYGPVSLAWQAGFMLGWLSALALSDRALALRGLALFEEGIQVCSRDEQERLRGRVMPS